MPTNDYHFITHWHFEASPQEVYDILSNPLDLVRWWPSVYLGVQELEKGDETGIGKVIRLYTKGWLPYTLQWDFKVTEVQPLKRMALEAYGDFVGRGVWTFEPVENGVNITYDWRIQAEKPLLRRLTPLMKPIFAANHHWAMQMGEQSLNLELARRHAPNEAERAKIPAPPAPTFGWAIRKPF